MNSDDYRHFVCIVAGDNPSELMEPYDKNKKVEPYIVYRYSDAEEIRQRYIESYRLMLTQDNCEFEKEYINEMILDAASEGKRIVIDNLNLKFEYRNSYKSLLSNYYVEWKYIYVEAENLSVNMARRASQIAENVFKEMINKLEWPTIDEYKDNDNFVIVRT